jgi:hypothetical protein
MSMEPRKVLEYLEDLALKLDIEVVYANLESRDPFTRGGLCRVKGKYKVFIDRSEKLQGRIKILARALSAFDKEEIYILPFVREILEKAKDPRQT